MGMQIHQDLSRESAGNLGPKAWSLLLLIVCLPSCAHSHENKRPSDPLRVVELARQNMVVIIIFFVGFLLAIGVLSLIQPTLFVRKRSGLGYTVNFTHPWAWPVTVALVVGILLLLTYLVVSVR
jgi:hypothetical protein